MIDPVLLAPLVGLNFGLVAALRKEWPKLDGRIVYGVTIAVGEAIAFFVAPSVDTASLRAIGWEGLQIAAGAIALASGGAYVAGKINPVQTAVVATVTADAKANPPPAAPAS